MWLGVLCSACLKVASMIEPKPQSLFGCFKVSPLVNTFNPHNNLVHNVHLRNINQFVAAPKCKGGMVACRLCAKPITFEWMTAQFRHPMGATVSRLRF